MSEQRHLIDTDAVDGSLPKADSIPPLFVNNSNPAKGMLHPKDRNTLSGIEQLLYYDMLMLSEQVRQIQTSVMNNMYLTYKREYVPAP